MTEKQELLKQYVTTYTPENRFGFCKLCLSKHRFELYSMKVKNEVSKDIFIVQNDDLRVYINNVIETNECSVEQLTHIFNNLNLEQIYYIGY